MRIVVTGATGFLGRALLLRLRAERHHVTALVRTPHKARSQLSADIQHVSLADRDAVRVAIGLADVVVNLAGEGILDKRWTATRKRALRDSRIELTQQLVADLAQRLSPLPLLISASAVGWYGDCGERIVDEQAGPGSDFAATLCRDWEAAAEAARPHAKRIVRARFGIVLGGEGGALASMRPLFRLGLGGRVGAGSQWVPWIHLEDAVAALLFAVHHPTLDGAVNLVAPTAARNHELSSAVGRALRRPAVLPAPAIAVRLALGERAALVLGGQRVEARALLAAGFVFRYPELSTAVCEALVGDSDEIALTTATGAMPVSDYLKARPARYQLSSRTSIDCPLEEVFEFFSAAQNLGAITPPDMGFTITTATPIAMAKGAVIDYRIRAAGVPLSWRTVIDVWEAPAADRLDARFVDSQAKGPYASWWHEHHFYRDGHRTVMEDRVLYSPPFGVLGRIANAVMIRSELRRIFCHRSRAIRLRFASRTDVSTDPDQPTGTSGAGPSSSLPRIQPVP